MTEDSATRPELVVEIPLASRVLVVGSLLLPAEPTETSTATAGTLQRDLERWQGRGVVVVAGDLIDGCADAGGVTEALGAHGGLLAAISAFAAEEGRRFLIVPAGSSRPGVEASSSELAAAGIELAEQVALECATAAGIRRVVVAGAPAEQYELADLAGVEERPWLEGIDRLADPSTVRRFTSSRTLYRRLSRWLWVPPVVAIVVAVLTHLTFFASGLRRIGHHNGRRVFIRVADAPWHVRFLWVAAAVVLAEVILGIAVALITRRAFDGALSTALDDARQEALGGTSLDAARAALANGAVGYVSSGALDASLTHLDIGFFAEVGASAGVVREHRGVLGLPPVFLDHRLETALEIETGADLHVRLLVRDQPLAAESRPERLAAGEPVAEIAPDPTGLRQVASWPVGGAWPPPPDLAATQRRARRVRRIGAASIFITGLIDLLVAVAPPLRGKLHTVLTYLPLGISETAGVLTALVGLGLVMLSRGVLRGQRRSWLVAIVLLAISMASHIAHAASFGPVIVTGVVFAFLLVERRWFQGSSDRSSLGGALPVIGLVLVVAVGASFLGVELSNLHAGSLPAWPLVLLAVTERLVGLTTVDLPDKIDDFVLPSMLTVGIGVIVVLLYLATRPVVDRRLSEHHSTSERRAAWLRARDIVRRHGKGSLDYFALRDDKQFFFYGDSVVAYAVYGGIALVSPDPVGPDAERTQVWEAFRSYADSRGWGAAVIGAGETWLPIYEEAGMRWLYLGDEAIVDIQGFSLAGGKMKGLRQANTRMERNGYTVEFLDPSTIDPARVPSLVGILSLSRTGEEERGFSMMLGRLFDPRDAGLLLAIVSGPDGVPAAMCQFVPSPAIGGYSLDLMRRDTGEHPNGLLDYALCQTIEHLRSQGATGLSLNFSAFRSTLDGEKGDGAMQRIERWGLRRLSSVLPIESLWKFNEKYNPSWLARYLVYPSPELFVPTAAAAMRAESLADIPVLGRFLASDPSNRPGMVVPPELLGGQAIEESSPMADH